MDGYATGYVIAFELVGRNQNGYGKTWQGLAYSRLVLKRRSKKLVLIAVTNKLLSQSFSIAKSGVKYDSDVRSVMAHN